MCLVLCASRAGEVFSTGIVVVFVGVLIGSLGWFIAIGGSLHVSEGNEEHRVGMVF